MLVLDAEIGVTEQDKKIGDRSSRRAKPAWWWSTSGISSRKPCRRRTGRKCSADPIPIHRYGPKAMTAAGRVRSVGAGEPVLPGLRPCDLHLGPDRISSRPVAGSHPLRGGPVAAADSHRLAQPHPARRRRAASTHQQRKGIGSSSSTPPRSARRRRPSCCSSTATSYSRNPTRSTWPVNYGARSATRAVRSCSCPNRARKPSNPNARSVGERIAPPNRSEAAGAATGKRRTAEDSQPLLRIEVGLRSIRVSSLPRSCPPKPLVHTPLFTTGEQALSHLHFARETVRFPMRISFA